MEQFSSFQLLSWVRLFATPWTGARQASLSITNSWSLVKLSPSCWWCHPTISCSVAPLLLLPSIVPSIRVYSSESALLIRWSRYGSFSFSFSPSNEYSELNSFRMDWFDLLAFKGLSRVFSQRHSLKASILWLSASLWLEECHHWLEPSLGLLEVAADSFQEEICKCLGGTALPTLPRNKAGGKKKKKTKMQLQFPCYISVISSV